MSAKGKKVRGEGEEVGEGEEERRNYHLVFLSSVFFSKVSFNFKSLKLCRRKKREREE